MHIMIGGAWPYANGDLHIGHLAALLPGDVIARYHRARGHRVAYVSGSDCHGTPVALRARQEGKTPREISDHYHASFADVFRRLGFSYDRYGKTSDAEHKDFVRAFHTQAYKGPYVYEKETPQAICRTCNIHLVDRMVVGGCPLCGADARGDQCDACGAILEATQLVGARCVTCGHAPDLVPEKHLYLAISRMEDVLRGLVDANPGWRRNATAFTQRYIGEGLRDRAITRTLDWGIDVPRDGYEKQRIYIWAENVLGYLSMSAALAREGRADMDALWFGPDAKHYYVHGKDNIPFHTIILPALLHAHGGGWHQPDEVISSEFMTLEGRRISTSHNWAVWLKDIVGRYHPDALRYYFLINGPERRDADFSWRTFVESNNGELLGAYGNFVHRTLAFVHRYLDGVVPEGVPDAAIGGEIAALYPSAGALLDKGRCKDALEAIFALVRSANRYFDAERPWITRTEDPARCANTLYQCVQLAANLAVLLSPFLPFSSEKVMGWLGLKAEWTPQAVPGGKHIPPAEVLFPRLDKSVVEEETSRIQQA